MCQNNHDSCEQNTSESSGAGIMAGPVRTVSLDEGKSYVFPTHLNEMLLPREETENIEVFRVVIEPRQYTHQHAHPDTEQVYIVLSGRGHLLVIRHPDRRVEYSLVPKLLVYIPRNAEHQVFCDSPNEPLVYICVDSFPGGRLRDEQTWEQHYREVIAGLTGGRVADAPVFSR